MSVFETVMEGLERLNIKNKHSIIIPPVESDRLMSICVIVDKLIYEFDGESYTVNIIPETLELCIDISLPEMIIEDCSEHEFFKLVNMVDSFSFHVDGENVILSISAKELFLFSK